MRTTERLYDQNPHLGECHAQVVKIDQQAVETDRTVAYAEGGGQEGDWGVIYCGDVIIRFVDTQKSLTMPAFLPDFPEVQIGGVIRHIVHEEDLPLLAQLSEHAEVIIRIDTVRRQQLSRHHSAAHLLLLAVMQQRAEIEHSIIGCHIKPGGARLDFRSETRFSPEEVAVIEKQVNQWIAADGAVRCFAHEQHADARFWQWQGHTMPCGGTHVARVGEIGRVVLKRQNIGKGKERLSLCLEI